MFEAEVLEGRALLLLSAPPEVRTRASLKDLFCVHFAGTAAAAVQDIYINRTCIPAPGSSSAASVAHESQTREEVGAVLFESSEAVRTVLQRIHVVSSGVAYQLELRRGYLTLGPHRLLVEGVLNVEASTPPDATARASVRRAARLSPHVDIVVGSNVSAPTAGGNEPLTTSIEHACKTEAHHNSAVLLFTFVLLGFRPTCASPAVTARARNDDGGKGTAQGLVAPFDAPVSEFTLTPYIVYQALRGECLPRGIVILTPRTTVPWDGRVALPVTRALVRLESAQVAQDLCRKMHGALIELMSPLPRSYRIGRDVAAAGGECGTLCGESRGWQTLTVQEPSVEARFRLFVRRCSAVEEAQGRLAWGQSGECTARDGHGKGEDGSQSRNTSSCLLLNHHNIGSIGCIFPRQWYAKACEAMQPSNLSATSPTLVTPASRPPSGRGEEDAGCDAVVSARPGVQTCSCHSGTCVAVDAKDDTPGGARQHQRHRHHHEHGHRRRRHRSPSPLSQSRRATNDDDRGDCSTHDVSRCDIAAPLGLNTAYPELGTIASGMQGGGCGDGAARGGVMTQSNVTLLEAVEGLACLPAVPATAMASLPAYDSLGPLPSGWRPVFSLEYKETYYVYRDPHTGMESTTWTRPV